MRRSFWQGAGSPLLYAALILIAGLAYRATFISQGFAATDEGWLQSLGSRIAAGQLPYRDFDYNLPPLSIYKEAALIRIFGDAYGVLASRWAFVVLATAGSLLTFLIIRRYVNDAIAFLATLPTIAFSVILYYFSNYNYDALVLLLAAIALLTWANDGWLLPLLAGLATGLAILAKPTYGALLPLVVLAGLVAPRMPALNGLVMRGIRRWPVVLLGAAIPLLATALAFIALGVARQFVYQAFFLYRAAHPGSLLSLIVQGIPTYVARPAGVLGIAMVVLLLLGPGRLPLAWLRLAAVVVIALSVLVLTVLLPDRAQPSFLVAAFECLWLINVWALVTGIRGGFPSPELPLFAMGLQYMAQITYNGVVLYYVGAYLTVPVLLIYLHQRIATSDTGQIALRRGWLRDLVPLAIGLWLIVGSILVTRMTVYEDASRSQLTAEFQSAKLHGISSLPATTHRIDAAVTAVDQFSARGQPVFAFPDLAVIYFLTDRRNPTRVDWYNTGSITSDEVQQAVKDLAADPPRVVLLQAFRESDFRRSERLDYQAEPKWEPIVQYLMAHYHQAGTAGDIAVLVPNG
jgi:hypothetical protein